jgi:hypothetical protein
MASLVKTLLFTSLLVIMGSTAHGGNQCVDIFLDVAKLREADILAALKEVEEIPLDSPRWENITPLGARNQTFKIELDSMTVVFKRSHPDYNYSPRWAFEVLGYQIAKRLHIETPVITQVRIGEVQGTAQVFVKNMQPLVETTGGPFIEAISPAIKLLNRVTLNADTNYRNILVPEGTVVPRWRDQTPIDLEMVFNRDPSFEGHRMLELGPRQFLQENIPHLGS